MIANLALTAIKTKIRTKEANHNILGLASLIENLRLGRSITRFLALPKPLITIPNQPSAVDEDTLQ
jgi:hypothetical protein